MRTLVLLAIVLLPACSTTPSGEEITASEMSGASSVERRLSRDGSRNLRGRCSGNTVLVCNSDDRNARCDCVNRNEFRRPVLSPNNTRHQSF